MIKTPIKGLIAAPFTPLNPDGSLNSGIIPDYAERLKKDGLKGVFVAGTTGEGMLLTLEERMEIAEKWVSEQTGIFKVIIHVGAISADQSVQLARHAEEIGVFATACMGPLFLPPGRAEDLIVYCEKVASGAPGLPFYYYHIPSVSGVQVHMSEFLQLAGKHIPNLAGIKYTHNDFLDMMECMEMEKGRWDILNGYDELLLAGLAMGTRGAVGSTYNYMAPLYTGLIHDFTQGNLEEARRKQAYSIRIIKVLNKHGGAIVAGKKVMKSAGMDCGPSRLSMGTGSGSDDLLFSELEDLGFSDLQDSLKN